MKYSTARRCSAAEKIRTKYRRYYYRRRRSQFAYPQIYYNIDGIQSLSMRDKPVRNLALDILGKARPNRLGRFLSQLAELFFQFFFFHRNSAL